MSRRAIVTRIAAIGLGAFLASHPPASAGLTPTLETTTADGTSWTYTATASEPTYTFGAIQGTDLVGGSRDMTTDAPGFPGSVSDAPAASVPEPGTLALLVLPLLAIARAARRHR